MPSATFDSPPHAFPGSDQSAPSSATFGELYRARYNLAPEAYQHHLLARTLYPHARLLAPLLRWSRPDYFSADLDLVRGASFVRRNRDLIQETEVFGYHPANVGVLRHVFRLRASTTRLHRIVRDTLARRA